ncbi:MAG: vitamin K epoxide reductase family protein [Gemmatimonadetes bacterium]|nr:vitamin K epoxide reductase family protein [Gemmatimonadota bacterium]
MLSRMGIALFALVGVLISAYMAAYTFGMVGTIACGTGGCAIVQNSPWSVFLGVPVPVIGLFGYGLLVTTALLGLQPRFADDRRIAALLLVGAIGGAAFSAYLTWLEASVIHAWCRWCVVSAILAGLILFCALPEAGRMRTQPEPGDSV